MTRLFSRPALALALLAMFTFGCERNSDLTNLSSDRPATEYAALDAAFTDYEIVTLDNGGILEQSATNKDAGFLLELNIPQKPEWSFNVVFHDFYDEDFKTFESDASGEWVEVPNGMARNDAFYGSTPVDENVHGMFIMLDDDLSGEIYENDVQYGLNPLSEWVPTADKDEYVLYRLDADVAGNAAICGTEDDHAELKTGGVAIDKMATCSDMSLNYVADYEMWNNKFGRNDTDMRNYIENRLKFASYRYWGYNGYPLYFRLYTRYTRKDFNNRPMTSGDRSGALAEWRTWGNNPDNIRYADERVLFTGRDYGGLFGIAYTRAMCRRTNDQYLSFAYVTKIDGISPAVYSKVTGHEVGHNLGAGHQDEGFMQQGRHSNRGMPQSTRSELDSHLSGNSSCLDPRECVNYRGL